MAYRILRYVGGPEPREVGKWTVRALVQSGSRKAWVVATGDSNKEALSKVHELVAARVRDWEAHNDE